MIYGNYFLESSIISYSDKFSDVKNIVDSLNDKELHSICNGNFKSSPYIKIRKVLLINNEPAAFIDIYSIPKEMNKDEAVLVCACKSKFRGNNYIEKIFKSIKKSEFKNAGIKTLYWETTTTNKKSSSIAKKLGFTKEKDINKDDDNYKLLL